MKIIKLIWNFLNEIIKELCNSSWDDDKKTSKGLGGLLGLSGLLGLCGLIKGIRANKTNEEANTIKKEALKRYELSYMPTQESLLKLGNLQMDVVGTFDDFVEAMERIDKHSKGFMRTLSGVKLPEYHPEDLKKTSGYAQLVIAGGTGAAVGAGIGVAAFGIVAASAASAALGGGFIICLKGFNLSKKAVKNKKEAIRIQKDVEEIIKYLKKLENTSNALFNSIYEVNEIYREHLSKVCRLIEENQSWKKYTEEQKLLIKDTVLLVNLLNRMCSVQLVMKATDDKSLEKVNEENVKKLICEADALIPNLS